MNIHPIFVHFPIALLTVYAVMELARFPWLRAQSYWFYVRSGFLIVGALSAHATIATGLLAERFMEGNPALEVHEFFAFATAVTFDVLAICYAVAWINRQWPGRGWQQRSWWRFLTAISVRVADRWPAVVLALLGLILVTITGSLGGSMVYGENNDPMVKLVYKIFVE